LPTDCTVPVRKNAPANWLAATSSHQLASLGDTARPISIIRSTSQDARQRRQVLRQIEPPSFHDSLAVGFDRALCSSELMRDLLVDFSPNNEVKNLPFARRQTCKTNVMPIKCAHQSACFLISRQCPFNRANQFTRFYGLRQEVVCPALSACTDVGMAGDKHAWKCRPKFA